MSFELEQFRKWRPYLYHNTAVENLKCIQAMSKIFSAQSLSGNTKLDSCRKRPTITQFANESVWLQTQAPLRAGNIDFLSGFKLIDLLELLNGKVFFWPKEKAGLRHGEVNEWPSSTFATIRIRTEHVIEKAEYCRYNSGSPRCVNGRKSPRGPELFHSADKFDGTISEVVEVVFDHCVDLPKSAEYKRSTDRDWKSLFGGQLQ